VHFGQAVKLAPDYGEAWMNWGVVALHDAQWDKAVEYSTKALANGARLVSEPLARTNLGWAYYKDGDLSHATTELLQALQLEPNYCLARYRLAQVYFDRERFDEAAELLTVYQAAEQGKPPLCARPVLEALYLGGQNSLRNHDIESAVQWFQQCIEAAPRSCVAHQCEKALGELGGP
jgi:type IV pilus assembly protein PilF